jgi:transcriptional regulator with XRE-family HTH domain
MDAEFFWILVKKEIKKQNTTQEWLARKAEIPLGTLKQQIHHKRTPDVLQAFAIAEALEVPIEYLATGHYPTGLTPAEQQLVKMYRRMNDRARKMILKQVEEALQNEFAQGRAGAAPPEKQDG